MSVAFFDLDRTVLAVNSAALWLRLEVAAGHVSRLQALRAAVWLAGYSAGLVSVENAVRKAIFTLAGIPAAPIRGRMVEFFQAHLRQGYRPGALTAVEEHRLRGDKLVLLTASTSYLAELVAQDLRFDAYLSNELEVDAQGHHTGRTVGELCFGSGKLGHARAYVERVGAELEDCAFYTDSYSDLPALEAMGRPVAVNPDQRLRREALRRGWQIVDWGAPARPPGGRSPPSDRTGAPPGLQ
ncbi:MAG: HAD family phosphatase [Myxococcota bacterium]|nr:HAD family phosphatase [Myxococcota bacterium]